MIGIHEAALHELIYVGSRLCADDRRELALTRDPDDAMSLAGDAWISTVCKVAHDGADPVMAFGAKIAAPGTAIVWGFKTERGRRAIRQVTKHIRRTMIPMLRDLGVRRAVCLVHPDNKASQVWLQHLGFRHTATRRDIGTQGEEVHLFQRDEPDV